MLEQKESWIPRNKTHGLSYGKFYRAYYLMKDRCTNPKNSSYFKYGGQGIKCLWNSFDEFKKDMYSSFLKHVKDYGERNTTIDRIDSEKDYSKKNCRWATYEVQNNNRRGLRLLTFRGATKPVTEWARKTGLVPNTIFSRLDSYGWSPEKALNTPARSYNRKIKSKI